MLTEEILRSIAPRVNSIVDTMEATGTGSAAQAIALIVMLSASDETFAKFGSDDPDFILELMAVEGILNRAGIDTGNGLHVKVEE